MSSTMHRRDRGQAMRTVRKKAGMTMQQLAKATKLVDPFGAGVSWNLISLLESGRDWGRETTTEKTAFLLEDTLKVPRGTFFYAVPDDVAQEPDEDADAAWEAL